MPAMNQGKQRWLGKSEHGDKWSFCLMATNRVADRRHDEQETSPEPQPGIQGKGRIGGGEGRGAIEEPIDVKTLHAKIGVLTLINDFLSGALGKAGLLPSAKR